MVRPLADPFVPCLAKDIHVTPLLIRLLARSSNSVSARRMKGKLVGRGEGGKNVPAYTDLGLEKYIETQIFFAITGKLRRVWIPHFVSIIRWGERCIYIKYISLFLPPSPSILHVSIIPNYPSVNPYLSLSLSPRNPEIKEISTGRLPRQRRRFQRRGRDTAREARRFSWHVIARKSFRVS